MVVLSGPLAMISCEPRQARKGATVVVSSCAEVWLVRTATQFSVLARQSLYLSSLLTSVSVNALSIVFISKNMMN